MRIIKPGREPKKEIELTCERCGCVFAYGKEDVRPTGDPSVKVKDCVICPHCGELIYVEPFSGY